jgi:hypothetical protein
VVHAVADEVDERLADLVDDRLVDARRLAFQDQLDLLARLAREVAHQAREALEHVPDGEHPHVHDRLLELLRHAATWCTAASRLARRRAAPPRRQRPGHLLELRAMDDQLADQVQQVVELGELDAHHARLRV